MVLVRRWYVIIGSAEALPILCVSDFCERERERERRLWRHWYHAEIASDHAYDYLDGAYQRVDAFWLWACRELELRSACKDKELGAWALDWAAGSRRVIDERRWGSGSFAFAGQTAVDHPAAFRWHASSKKNRPSWCLFPFRMAMVLPLRTAWIADILSQASLRDEERQRCWKRGSGDGQRLWDYFTARLSDLQFNAVDKRGLTLTWTVCKAIGGSR